MEMDERRRSLISITKPYQSFAPLGRGIFLYNRSFFLQDRNLCSTPARIAPRIAGMRKTRWHDAMARHALHVRIPVHNIPNGAIRPGTPSSPCHLFIAHRFPSRDPCNDGVDFFFEGHVAIITQTPANARIKKARSNAPGQKTHHG